MTAYINASLYSHVYTERKLEQHSGQCVTAIPVRQVPNCLRNKVQQRSVKYILNNVVAIGLDVKSR